MALCFLVLTRFKLLYGDWRGYVIALFALVYVANFYMGLFGRVKLEVRKSRAEIEAIEAEVDNINGSGAPPAQMRGAGLPRPVAMVTTPRGRP